nr:DNA translocase FtsK [Oharaeibacter diazotrophicus]
MRSTERPPVLPPSRSSGAAAPSRESVPPPVIAADDPTWLRPFATAPNVRFTRTPESLIRSRSRAAEPAPVAEPAPAVVETVAPVAAPPPVVAAPVVAVAPVAAPVVEAAPKPVDPRFVRKPLVFRRAPQGETMPIPQPASTPEPVAATPVPEPVAPVRGRSIWLKPLPVAETRPAEQAPVAATAAEPAPAAAAPAPAAEPAAAVVAPVLVDDDGDLVGLRVLQGYAVRATFHWPLPMETDEAPAEAAPPPAAEAAVEAVPAEVHAPEPARPQRAPGSDYELPSLDLLAHPPGSELLEELSAEALDKSSLRLQQTLHDFGVRGEIIDANPGPVVTLYELEPAPGTKSSRVISLSNDIARSMSAVSCRVAVVEGRNVIGIELPNPRRETVWLREMLASSQYHDSRAHLPVSLGKTIGGEPVIADLARMPHLLVAGTTGSGKSVAINTMILSLLYRYSPAECRLIMIDPKMLELSVYEGIPHLLTPVVTDPRKAVVALKWAVREMESRYRKMSRLGVRNIDGYNTRLAEARANGEVIMREVETGYDSASGQVITTEEPMSLDHLPFIVVVVDEMADLMMVAGKDIEGAIQRLAQMARAAGIHIVMATQRPSVDVITGTIKANFPTRISFQVTSKIDSRTILGEQGAEQLLGQGDMLMMAGGGRIQRIHGPFVSDQEVEKVVLHWKAQGRPEYLEAVTAADEAAPAPAKAVPADVPVMDAAIGEEAEDGLGDVYDQAVQVVLRDRKASTSYVQRRLQIGYNRAASIMERMERDGIVGPANHAGKREIYRAAPPPLVD